jgi:hypothetical protein
MLKLNFKNHKSLFIRLANFIFIEKSAYQSWLDFNGLIVIKSTQLLATPQEQNFYVLTIFDRIAFTDNIGIFKDSVFLFVLEMNVTFVVTVL